MSGRAVGAALVAEHAADLERGRALQRRYGHAVRGQVLGEFLARGDLRAPPEGGRENVDPRGICERRAPAVRAFDDRSPERDLAKGGAEDGAAEAVTEA